ncbi:class I SAM-dependent methyltransferase [Methanolobus mangrovi]|uniref:Arsenite methyltransferase n=1 Tax=Methanolobus mangrovi TaxID=3072977 RepID=A0AA51YGA8_9EURY|nr:class I SAM-dependent methyltransferase [Methanolobus mangrovi]WMW21826.1 class I SAM-dependent methyltransferase [Methanolobus mangrovi]
MSLLTTTHVCPTEISIILNNRIRRWLQNPRKILGPYIKEGMDVLEVGCGPGFFTLDMARMVGENGQVVAVDLQEGMLAKVREKIRRIGTGLNIVLHKCDEDRIGVSGNFDFVFLFYMVHEVVDKEAFFRELESLLKKDGQIYIAEPPLHVSKKAFEETVMIAGKAGFTVVDRPKRFPDKIIVLKKA